MPTLPSIQNYLGYRQYLADAFLALKRGNAAMSGRQFARMAGSTSPNFLQFIVSGKLSISPEQVKITAAALGLALKDRRYFEALVDFDHAKTHGAKDAAFHRLMMLREGEVFGSIENDQYAYLSTWYNPVVRELVVDPELNGDPERIAECLVPAVSAAKIRKSIALLEKIGLISRESPTGKWLPSSRFVGTPAEVLSVAVVNYHRALIGLGAESLERFGPAERDIRSATLSLSNEGFALLKERMEATWRELAAFSDASESPDQVVQVNIQLFPLARKKRKS